MEVYPDFLKRCRVSSELNYRVEIKNPYLVVGAACAMPGKTTWKVHQGLRTEEEETVGLQVKVHCTILL